MVVVGLEVVGVDGIARRRRLPSCASHHASAPQPVTAKTTEERSDLPGVHAGRPSIRPLWRAAHTDIHSGDGCGAAGVLSGGLCCRCSACARAAHGRDPQ